MNKKNVGEILFLIEQKKFTLEEEVERFGNAPIVEGQIDILNDLLKDIRERFKYTEEVN
jgi:hypothetical protein